MIVQSVELVEFVKIVEFAEFAESAKHKNKIVQYSTVTAAMFFKACKQLTTTTKN